MVRMEWRACVVAWVALSVFAIGGCGDDPDPSDIDGDGEAATLLDRAAAQDDVVAAICRCYDVLDLGSEEACRQGLAAEFAWDGNRVCIAQVDASFAGDPSLDASLDCQVRAFVAAAGCFEDIVTCSREAIDACLESGRGAVEACPALSAEVETALDGCTIPP